MTDGRQQTNNKKNGVTDLACYKTLSIVLLDYVKVGQINYVSRNQFHSTKNLNFGLMCKKAKHCRALSTNFSVQLMVFLDHVLLLVELLQKFKISVWRSVSMKQNFGEFPFIYVLSYNSIEIYVIWHYLMLLARVLRGQKKMWRKLWPPRWWWQLLNYRGAIQ